MQARAGLAASAAALRGLVAVAAAVLPVAAAYAQGGPRGDVTYEHVAGNVYILMGGGGANISMSAGPDGVLIVDGKGPDVTDRIVEIAASLSDKPIRYLINTHEHPDHTGGNANFGERGVIIIANNAVRDVLMAGQRGGPPSPPIALPTVTFPEGGGLNLEFNGERIEVFHVPPAHAPGNSIVYFTGSNVMHVGDLFGPARYPIIADGTYGGFIEALNIAIRRADVDTAVIAGVGPVSDREGLIQYREMLLTTRDKANAALDAGQTLEEFVASNPTREYDSIYGDPGHPLFLPILYAELAAQRQ